MTVLRKPAVRISQGKRSLFLTSFTVAEFLSNGFYRVDRLDVQEGKGMQRLLSQTRARSFGNDLIDAQEHNEAFLPTSVFLATSGSVDYDEETSEIAFPIDAYGGVCPFDVVDGQHRLEGLKIAAESTLALLDFPLAVVIAHEMGETDKMLQFITVNTKQRSVDRGVAQHITARFSRMIEVADVPHLPKWLRREVERGSDDRALDIVMRLNNEESSAWFQRIQFADEARSSTHTITQNGFVTPLKRIVLNKFHTYNTMPIAPEKRIAVMMNFWLAVESVFVGEADGAEPKPASVVYKTNGVVFFFTVLDTVLGALLKDRDFTKEAFVNCMSAAADHLDPDSAVLMSPEFWMSGGLAGSQNARGMERLAATYSEAIVAAATQEISV
ncbi:MAG: DGQHR domain-containing protein [Chloroflexi bacterium]|nr:DGQHR domain-containing protein [Chloroflexota bacterium]